MKTNSALKNLLITHEGIRRFPYTDTKGFITIGVGHNLSIHGLPSPIIDSLLESDLAEVERQLWKRDWFVEMLYYATEAQCDAIRDLAFNLGTAGLDKFVETIKAIQQKDWEKAAREIRNSQWAQEVQPTRVDDIAHMISTGEYPGFKE
jgi:lysozyme